MTYISASKVEVEINFRVKAKAEVDLQFQLGMANTVGRPIVKETVQLWQEIPKNVAMRTISNLFVEVVIQKNVKPVQIVLIDTGLRKEKGKDFMK